MPEMTFGKYAGWDLEDVPTGYLEWLVRAGVIYSLWLLEEVEGELSRRTDRTPPGQPGRCWKVEEEFGEGPGLAEKLERWRQALLEKYTPFDHPLIEDAYESLREALGLKHG